MEFQTNNNPNTDEQYPEFNYEKILNDDPNKNAVLFDIHGDGTKQVWIPRSQMEHDEENKCFNIPAWLAKDKELI